MIAVPNPAYFKLGFCLFAVFIITGRFSAVISAYYAERNNYYFFEEEGRQTAFMQ